MSSGINELRDATPSHLPAFLAGQAIPGWAGHSWQAIPSGLGLWVLLSSRSHPAAVRG